MTFNTHSELDGRHAVLSPSRPYWLNYDDEALEKFYASSYATDIGTLVHEYACDRIHFKMPIDIENDEDGELMVEKYQIRSVPTTVLADENGDVIYKLMGNIPLKDFLDVINKALEDR